MPDYRWVLRRYAGDAPEIPIITYHRDEHSREGIWSRPGGLNLFFANKSFPGIKLKYSNGPIGAAVGGQPLQLIFWGDWWNTALGNANRLLIEERTKGLLESPYFTELVQYGIPHSPSWRGSVVRTKSKPPVRVGSREATRRCLDLVNDMIEEGIFPDPDDGPRIVFIVLMPSGFTVTNSEVWGAHKSSYDWDFFPFDADHYWVGWVRPESDPEETMVTLSHELVEILTDPEKDGWRWDPEVEDNTEISDGLQAPPASPGQPFGPIQTAWVGGAHVQSYWSSRHIAPVIPIDTDYAAQLRAKIKETSRSVVAIGKFRLDSNANAACSTFKACCFEDRDYEWRSYSINETTKIRAHTHRYRSPLCSWRINGQLASGVGAIDVRVPVESYNGRNPVVQERHVTVSFDTNKTNGIDISANGIAGNFEIRVSCTVIESAIAGDNVNNVVASPEITVDFVGTELLLEDAYTDQISKCWTQMAKKFDRQYKPTGKPGRGEPINFLENLLVQELPAYVRTSQYRQIREAVRQVRAANMMLPPEAAASFMSSAIELIPSLKLLNEQTKNGESLNRLE